MENMEQVVAELAKVIPFKDETETGDVVLVVSEEPQMVIYARVGRIERDTSKRDEWWHLTFDLLSLPPQRVEWTLRSPQFTGKEIFTMGGKKKFIRAVRFTEEGPEKQPGPGSRPTLRMVK